MKRIFLVVAVLTVLAIALVGYWMMSTRGLSPKETAHFEEGTVAVHINYGSPQMRGRNIFGGAEEKPVLEWGKYWRLGANEATQITTNTPLQFGTNVLQPGSYSLYAFPHPTHLTIVVNAARDRWGYSAPDIEKDLFRMDAAVVPADSTAEGFVVAFEMGPQSNEIRFQWSGYLAVLPFVVVSE